MFNVLCFALIVVGHNGATDGRLTHAVTSKEIQPIELFSSLIYPYWMENKEYYNAVNNPFLGFSRVVKKDTLKLTRDTSLKCYVCNIYVQTFEAYFNHSARATYVQKSFMSVCELLKPRFRSNCLRYFRNQGLHAIEAILRNDSVTSVCQGVNMCGKGQKITKMLTPLVSKTLLDMLLSGGASDYCTDCQIFFTYFESIVNSTKSADFFGLKLSKVCDAYNAADQSWCRKSFQNEFDLRLYSLILKGAPPITICQHLLMCRS